VKQAKNQWQILIGNRLAIPRNTTHRHSLQLQAVLTGKTLKG